MIRKIVRFYSRLTSQDNYERSNAITSVHFLPSRPAEDITRRLLFASTVTKRQYFGSLLLEELSINAGIPGVKLKISATKQYHKRRSGRLVWKRYGYYRPRSSYIYIQNRTAIQGKMLAPKTFINTLLHEWMHHYDYEKLKLRSIHTKGFYQRISSLKATLLP